MMFRGHLSILGEYEPTNNACNVRVVGHTAGWSRHLQDQGYYDHRAPRRDTCMTVAGVELRTSWSKRKQFE